MSDLDALLDAASERKSKDPEWATAAVYFGDEVVQFKFTELDGRTWAGCTLAAHPRKNNVVDAVFGFDVTIAAELAAPLCGVRIDGDTETVLTAEQWEKVFDTAEPRGLQAITDAVIAANESAHMTRLANAKKVLEGGYKPKPSSPAN